MSSTTFPSSTLPISPFLLRFKNWYVASVLGVQELLVGKSEPSKLRFVGERLGGGHFSPKMVSSVTISYNIGYPPPPPPPLPSGSLGLLLCRHTSSWCP